MIRKICLYGGPGCAKSTTAAGLFHKLKIDGFNTELVSEFIKTFAYEGRVPISFQQLYVFAQQLNREDVILPHVDFIITDSPILMNVAYSKKYNFPCWREQVNIALEHEKRFPGLHLFLDRTGIDYQQIGRYENSDEAVVMDCLIEDILQEYLPNYIRVAARDNDTIYATVLDKLKDSKNANA